jgi:hypothetical protein
MVPTASRLFSYRDHWLAQRCDSPFWCIAWWQLDLRHGQRRSTGTSNLEAANEIV